MNIYSNSLIQARKIIGSWHKVGIVCGGLSGKAVMKWRDKGRPPRTEYSGETNYASAIESATLGAVKADALKPDISTT